VSVEIGQNILPRLKEKIDITYSVPMIEVYSSVSVHTNYPFNLPPSEGK